MTDEDRGLPAWLLAMVFAMALVAGAAVALLMWMIVYVIPALRASMGGVS